ncbi:ankyrin repeat domain-containing protein [Legionella sp. WA2022007384]
MVPTETTGIVLKYEELTSFLKYMFEGTYLADEMEGFGHCNGFSSLFMNSMRQGEKGRSDFYRRIEIIRELLKIKDQTSSISTLSTVPEHMQDLIREVVLSLQQETNSQEPSFFVNGDLPILNDLTSFAQELVVYHDPASFTALFEGSPKEPVGQVAELVYPLMFTPKEYKKCSVEKFSVGIYNKTEFLHYFDRLHNALETEPTKENESPNPAVSFLMGTTTHSISIGYDTTTKKWFISNSEDIKKDYLIDGTPDTGKLAEWVFNALVRKDVDKYIAFSSTIFADTTRVEVIKETLKKDAAWQVIHDPTRKECINYLSYNDIRLLHILVAEADLSTIANYLDFVKKLTTNTSLFFNTTNYLDQILNAQDKFGYTPLMFAIDKADFERVELLLQYNPDLNLKNKNSESEGQTALEIAQHNLKQYRESGGGNKQIIESYSKIIDVLENHLKLSPTSNKH